MLWCTYSDADTEAKQKSLCVRDLVTAGEIPVLSMVRYLKNQYAEQVWAPKEFEGGGDGFNPCCSVRGHLGASYTHKSLDPIT
jgi:hypothetical protein